MSTPSRHVSWAVVLLALLGTAVAWADDPGYFLSLRQKGQLIWRGSIDDSAGRTYDVWIVPGYVPPSRYAWESLQETGEDFGEYFGSKKYRDLGRNASDAIEWAFGDVLLDFTVEGAPRAWGDHFRTAGERTRRRVFGWWMAYPWALLASVADNAVRIPVGLIGTAAGVVYGGAIVPSFYLVNSAVVGTWDLAVNTVAVPACGYAWNTAIAPPMALVGQKPAPSRVDGFWVRRADRETEHAAKAELAPSADLDSLLEWSRILSREFTPYWERIGAIDKQQDEVVKVLQAEMERKRELLATEAATKREVVKKEIALRYKTLAESPEHQDRTRKLETSGLSSTYLLQHRETLVVRLWKDGGLSALDARRIVDFLIAHPPTSISALSTDRPPELKKTDPIRFSVEEGKGALKGDHSDAKP